MSATGSGNVMGTDTFLQLFTTQLQYQDPLQPMDSSGFAAQLAQFSSLEQLTNLNTSVQGLVSNQQLMNNGMAAGLIGKNITTQDGVNGKVTGVDLSGGNTGLILDNGKTVPFSGIQEINS